MLWYNVTLNASSPLRRDREASGPLPTRASNVLALAASAALHVMLGAAFLANAARMAERPVEAPAIEVVTDTPPASGPNGAEAQPPPVERLLPSPTEPPAEREPGPAPQPMPEREVQPEPALEHQPEPPPRPELRQPAAREVAPAPVARPRPLAASRPKAPAIAHPETALPGPAGPPVETPRAAVATAVPEVSPGWRAAIGAWLQSHKAYPEAARARGEEGSATVRFTIDRGGRVLEFTILQGTGSTDLDEAVERMLRGARVPGFPATMTQAEVSVTVRVRYTLQP